MKRLAVVVAACVATSGCGGFAGLSDLPLPGGPDVGDNPITITIEARDVLNLSRQATVKVDDVTVGQVDAIRRVGWTAEVTVSLRRDAHLPANTVAAIRQTGLLGEKYVELAPPIDAPATGTLADGDRIRIDRTSRSFEVEEVLGSLSMLLNGSGLERIRTITVELNKALGGREQEFRSLLAKLNSFTGTLSANRQSIVQAIDGLDRLSASAAAGRNTIARALDALGPSLKVLAQQREALVHMLGATSRLARVSTDVVVRTRRDLVADLESLAPVLTKLAEAGDSIPGGLEYALTFPFSTEALTALKGDYFNFDLDVSLTQLGLENLLAPKTAGTKQSTAPAPAPQQTTPKSSALPQIPIVSDLLAPVDGLLGLLLGGAS